MRKIFLSTLLLLGGLSTTAQNKNSLQANVMYGSKIETVGIGLSFNLTGRKHEFSPSINLYLPKDDVKVQEINFDYHRLYGIGNKIKVFPILGLGIAVWDNSEDENSSSESETKFGVNLGLGGRYTINDKFDVGFQFKYSAMSHSASQSVPMLSIAYKI